MNTKTGGYIYDKKLVQYLRDQGENVRIISLPEKNYGRCLLDNYTSGFWREIRESKIDILIQDELTHPSLFALNLRIKRKLKIPIISIVHVLSKNLRDPEKNNTWYTAIERRYLKSVDGFVFISNVTRFDVQGFTGENKPFVTAYPAGDRFNHSITHAHIKKRAFEKEPLKILYLGNVTRNKKLHTLIDGLAQIPEYYDKLTVVGSLTVEPEYTAEIHRKIARKGLEQKIRLEGLVYERTAIKKYLMENHVMAVPSFMEGMALAYVEAMGFGLPVIATKNGASSELIENGVNGFLVEPGNANILKRIICMLNKDRNKLQTISLAAKKTFEKHPTWKDTCQSIYSFLMNFQIQNR
ncbi:glycosyltransferase family 4 protein [Caldithrix abyssi]|nr:glycosyltransferase family 4 protein [Caldithrix abyssi]